jgi:hypothetical protein
MQTIIYVSAILGAILTTYVSPYIRKKLLVEISVLVSIFCFVSLLFATDRTVLLVLLCINFVSQSNLISLVVLFVTENVVEEEGANHTMILFAFYNIGSLLNGVFFLIFRWEKVFLFYFIISMVLILILLKVYIKETPFDLIINYSPE